MIKAIRERLGKATPGEWEVRLNKAGKAGVAPVDSDGFIVTFVAGEAGNAEFIAHAPTDIKYLLDLVERLEGAIRPIVNSINHTKIFIETREKMHPDGRRLWLEEMHELRDALHLISDKRT